MHENLKSTINLQRAYNEREDNTLWQTLVPAYEYGTFFVLYGKFRGEYGTDATGKPVFRIQEADFYLQNYQGLITIGLERIEKEIDVLYDLNINAPVYVLKIYLKALEINSEIEAKRITVKERPSIRKYKDINGERLYEDYIVQNNELKLQHPLRVTLFYDFLSSYYFDAENLSGCRIIGDREYQRDGDQLLKKKFEKVNSDSTKVSIRKGAGTDAVIIEEEGTIESDKCYPTYARLI